MTDETHTHTLNNEEPGPPTKWQELIAEVDRPEDLLPSPELLLRIHSEISDAVIAWLLNRDMLEGDGEKPSDKLADIFIWLAKIALAWGFEDWLAHRMEELYSSHDPQATAKSSDADVALLLLDLNIVISNAFEAYLELPEEEAIFLELLVLCNDIFYLCQALDIHLISAVRDRL